MCPVCTVGVIAGLGISRLLGIDDVITSLWIGAFILSFSFITIDWINKKWPKIKFSRFQIPFIALMYVLVLVPLKWNGSIGIPLNTLGGIDKIVLGTVIGSIVFLVGVWADKKVRKVKGKQLMNFQKVVFPVTILAIVSLAMYFVVI
jgi:hypothetical protein